LHIVLSLVNGEVKSRPNEKDDDVPSRPASSRRPAERAARVGARLGNAVFAIGYRETGTARLGEAVTAYRLALEERTRARVPHDWETTPDNLKRCRALLKQRRHRQSREKANSSQRCVTFSRCPSATRRRRALLAKRSRAFGPETRLAYSPPPCK
jgi:hypothetical protein